MLMLSRASIFKPRGLIVTLIENWVFYRAIINIMDLIHLYLLKLESGLTNPLTVKFDIFEAIAHAENSHEFLYPSNLNLEASKGLTES